MNFYSPLISALVTFLLINIILNNKFVHKIQDVPNERSLHSSPVPRIGGLGLIAGVLSGWMILFNTLVWWVVLPMLTLFVVSLFDDMHKLSVRLRLLVHSLAASIVVVGAELYTQQGVFVAVMMLFSIIWMTNLYNFMDGSDGLAGGMALIGFSIYGIGALLTHNTSLALMNFCIASSAAIFLYYNFHPAKIFMGDAGSISLGFLAAVMGLLGWQQGSWAAWFPILVFSPFIVDASATLMRRVLRGARVTEAHREHYYQRLIQLGWGHRNVSLAEYLLMLAVGITALSALQQTFPWQMLLTWCAVYICMLYFLDKRWKNYKRGKSD